MSMTVRQIVAMMQKSSITYATWNPSDKGAGTLSNGNLTFAPTGPSIVRSTIGKSSGKWYWEMTVGASSNLWNFGIATSSASLSSNLGVDAHGYAYYSNGLAASHFSLNNNTPTDFGANFTTGDVIGVALDLDGGTLKFYKNGSLQGTAFSGLSGTFYAAYGADANGDATANFGASAFAHSVPSGYNSGLYN